MDDIGEELERLVGDSREIDDDASSNTRVAAPPHASIKIESILRIPVVMQVIMGSATMPVSNLLKLGRGAVVPLDHRIGEPVDVVVNGRLIARGEVVLIEDETTRFGVSLTEIIEPGIAASSIGRDPPPMNWSILRYVFGHQEEDHKCRESITSPRR